MRPLIAWAVILLKDAPNEMKPAVRALIANPSGQNLYRVLKELRILNRIDLLPTEDEVAEWFKTGQVSQ